MRRVKYYVFGKEYQGWFHGWAGTSEEAYAIVEWDGGTVHTAHWDDVQFIDLVPEVQAHAALDKAVAKARAPFKEPTDA